MTSLPRYKSHKIVEAAKIRALSGAGLDGGASLDLMDQAGHKLPTIHVSIAYCEKHRPNVGGYYVRYPDGYESWSPADAFEEGYTRVKEDPVEKPAIGQIVHYHAGPADRYKDWQPALVVYVHPQGWVSLVTWDHLGVQRFRANVYQGERAANWRWPPREHG